MSVNPCSDTFGVPRWGLVPAAAVSSPHTPVPREDAVPNWIRLVRNFDGQDVPGTYLRAFIHNGDYFVEEIKIFANGLIDCWGEVDLEGFKRKVREGWVVTRLPEGARVRIEGGTLTATEVKGGVPEEEFIKHVADEIEELNGRPTTRDLCLQAWELFQRDPSEEMRAQLRAAYEAVPAHRRLSVLGEGKPWDRPILEALYGPDADQYDHRQQPESP